MGNGAATNVSPVAYLGPEGTFSHLVAKHRFPGRELVPLPSLDEVFDYLEKEDRAGACGIVPIENSSGGIIIPTVSRIVEDETGLSVIEELSLNVQLALVGREGEEITAIYSHFAPFHHCQKWLKLNYPNARQAVAPSTSNAVQFAVQEPGAAAIAPRETGELHGLDVLHFPIEAQVPNITQFFTLSRERNTPDDLRDAREVKTSLVVVLPDTSGSLCKFLEPFSRFDVNLKRIESRPIIGHPNKYRFFIEIEGASHADRVATALDEASAVAQSVRNVGSYPVGPRYDS